MALLKASAIDATRVHPLTPAWRRVESAVPCWPPHAMETFAVRMARHGIVVSSIRMKYDARYALEHLSQAHTLADTGLREFAVELFRHFERRQSALACGN